MSTIRPTTSTPSLVNPQNTTPVAIVQGAPSILGRISVGQILEATVISQTAKDTFQVQTPLGQFLLNSTLNLPKGGTLMLQLSSQSPFMQFHINSLNGENLKLKTKTEPKVTSNTSQKKWSPSTKLVEGKILLATLIGQLSGPQKISTQIFKENPILPTTTTTDSTEEAGAFLKKIGSTRGGSTKQSIINLNNISAVLKDLKPSQGLTSLKIKSVKNPKAPEEMLIGSKINVKVISIQPPDPNVTEAISSTFSKKNKHHSLSLGSNLKGVVSGTTGSGQPIIQTKVGFLNLSTQTNIPLGSTIFLEVTQGPSGPTSEAQLVSPFNEGLFRARKWPALEQTFQIIEEVHPRSTPKLINSIIPRPGVALISNVIFFLSALRAGDLHAWVGEKNLRIVERHQPYIASKMREDFTTLSKMVEEPQSGDWRVALIPINSGDEIQQMRLLLRQNEDEKNKGNTKHTRFIIDVVLSKLGRLQLDGLVGEGDSSLELIIRSDSHLAELIQNNIRTIFIEAIASSGIRGGVNFQASPANFVDIPDPEVANNVGLEV